MHSVIILGSHIEDKNVELIYKETLKLEKNLKEYSVEQLKSTIKKFTQMNLTIKDKQYYLQLYELKTKFEVELGNEIYTWYGYNNNLKELLIRGLEDIAEIIYCNDKFINGFEY